MDEREKRLGEIDAEAMRQIHAELSPAQYETQFAAAYWLGLLISERAKCLRLMAQQEQMLGALRQKGGAMKEAQPTCTHGATNYKLGNTYCAQCNLWLHSGKPSSGSAQLVGLRAELEQVRRDNNALHISAENLSTEVGSLRMVLQDQRNAREASESREKRVREALERTVGCLFASIRSNKPVRDADEVIVAARRALEGE